MSQILLTRWAETVRRHGHRAALILAATGERFTFRELAQRAIAWRQEHGSHLSNLAGQAVVFALPNGPQWFDLMLGLSQTGAIAVPVDAAEPIAAQRQLAESLRAGALWENNGLAPLTAHRAKRFRDPGATLIKLTSGSTGAPRPLLFTAEQLIADGEQVAKTMGLASSDCNYALIPFGHSYGLGNLTLPLLLSGIPIVCGSSPLPHAITADFAAHQPTVFPGVPAVFRGLAATADISLRSLRLAISAGAPLSIDLAIAFERRFGKRLHSFYGSSETGGITYDRDGSAALTGAVGTAMENVRLSFLMGQRLLVSSPAVVTAGNRRKGNAHGAFLMADRVAVDANGVVRLLGRRGTTVKIGGRRVELADVAARIRRLTGVNEVWVGASEGADPVLGVAVATQRTSVDLRRELHADTPAWKIPRKWMIVTSLPVSQRGKVDTASLRSQLFGAATPPS